MIEIRSVRDLLRLLFIFGREFRLAFLCTVVVALLGAFLLPLRYESEARLLVKPGRENATVPIEYGDRQALVAPSTQRDPIVDEEKMLTGRPIIRQVAEYYLAEVRGREPDGLWETIKFHAKKMAKEGLALLREGLVLIGLLERQSEEERLAAKLEKAFEVSHAAGSSVMEISFTWDDPAVAQQVVQKWIEVYLDERTQALGRRSLYQFYEEESGKLADQIASTKAAISTHLQEIDGVSSRERLDSLGTRINSVVAQVADAQAERISLEAGVLAARQRERALPAEVMKEKQLGLNPAREDLLLKLNGLELERIEKLKEFREEAPPIKSLDAAIAALKVRIAREGDLVTRSKNLAPNEIAVMLQRNALERDVRVNELKAQIAAYDKELESLRTERQRILSVEPELARLESNLAAAEKNYLLYRDSLEKARIDHELDASRISNIAIIEKATFKPARVFPKSLPIVLLAVPVGLAVGLLTVYLCFLIDLRIHDAGHLEARFKVPVWSSIPEATSESEDSPAFQASLYRLYSLLPMERVAQEGLSLGLCSARNGEGVGYVARYLQTVLRERGISVRLSEHDKDQAQAGEVVFLLAPALASNHAAFVRLKQADVILLVIEAGKTRIPMVENAVGIVQTAFGKVDGLVLNRRRLEIPARVLAYLDRLRGNV